MFEAAAKKHLTGVATWTTPVAGMFLYIHMELTQDGSEGDSFAVIREKAVEKGVLAVPGTSFMPSGSTSAFVRVSFSLATEDQADEGFKRLRSVIDDVRAGR
jgi:tryptophan aminotransferase